MHDSAYKKRDKGAAHHQKYKKQEASSEGHHGSMHEHKRKSHKKEEKKLGMKEHKEKRMKKKMEEEKKKKWSKKSSDNDHDESTTVVATSIEPISATNGAIDDAGVDGGGIAMSKHQRSAQPISLVMASSSTIRPTALFPAHPVDQALAEGGPSMVLMGRENEREHLLSTSTAIGGAQLQSVGALTRLLQANHDDDSVVAKFARGDDLAAAYMSSNHNNNNSTSGQMNWQQQRARGAQSSTAMNNHRANSNSNENHRPNQNQSANHFQVHFAWAHPNHHQQQTSPPSANAPSDHHSAIRRSDGPPSHQLSRAPLIQPLMNSHRPPPSLGVLPALGLSLLHGHHQTNASSNHSNPLDSNPSSHGRNNNATMVLDIVDNLTGRQINKTRIGTYELEDHHTIRLAGQNNSSGGAGATVKTAAGPGRHFTASSPSWASNNNNSSTATTLRPQSVGGQLVQQHKEMNNGTGDHHQLHGFPTSLPVEQHLQKPIQRPPPAELPQVTPTYRPNLLQAKLVDDIAIKQAGQANSAGSYLAAVEQAEAAAQLMQLAQKVSQAGRLLGPPIEQQQPVVSHLMDIASTLSAHPMQMQQRGQLMQQPNAGGYPSLQPGGPAMFAPAHQLSFAAEAAAGIGSNPLNADQFLDYEHDFIGPPQLAHGLLID